MPKGYAMKKHPEMYERNQRLSWYGVMFDVQAGSIIGKWHTDVQEAVNEALNKIQSRREDNCLTGNMLVVKIVKKITVDIKTEVIDV